MLGWVTACTMLIDWYIDIFLCIYSYHKYLFLEYFSRNGLEFEQFLFLGLDRLWRRTKNFNNHHSVVDQISVNYSRERRDIKISC